MQNDDKDYLGQYMAECPKCGHRYNKRIHGNKCPDCGYRKNNFIIIPYIIVIDFVLFLLFDLSLTNRDTSFINTIIHSDIFLSINKLLSIVNPVYILIGLNIMLYFCGFNSSNTSKYGNSYQDTIILKERYRLISSGFAHGDLFHIACNMFSLYNIGTFVYSHVGALFFIIIYFACLIFGGLISVLIHHRFGDDYVYSIGASGAICGLIGYYVIYIIKLNINPLQSMEYIYNALLPIVVTALNPNIDSLGHLSGFLVGTVISFVLISNLSYVSVSTNGNSQTVLTNKQTQNVTKVLIYDNRYVDEVIKDTLYVENIDVVNNAIDDCLRIMANQIYVKGESVSINGKILDSIQYVDEKVIAGQTEIMTYDQLVNYLLYGYNGTPKVTFVLTYTGYDDGEYFEKTFYNGIERN